VRCAGALRRCAAPVRCAGALRRCAAPVRCPDFIYVHRNRIERLWARLKEWRAIATRYEKTACSFMGVLCLAAAMDWLK
jgi:transposase